MTNKVALFILDGWGLGQNPKADAIATADTPFFDSLMANYPHTTLDTFGEQVGLPFGQMGNSEVGHLNIGGGRVVYQELLKIDNAIQSGELATNESLKELFTYCKDKNKPLHLMGLISDGGVHSHTQHAIAICQLAHEFGLKEVYIHAFTDGRDTDPKSGLVYLQKLIDATQSYGAKVVSVIGRYYAMDRDKRWERVQKAYNLLVHGDGRATEDVLKGVTQSYAENITDEFLLPILDSQYFKKIEAEDAVFCFNFRTDRCREITLALTQQAFPEYNMVPLSLYYTTMTVYDETYKNVHTIFNNAQLKNTLGEVVSQHGLTQLRAAETEKYPHVTFFFNGGREAPFAGEYRIMAPSPKVSTYDLQPEMSALELTASAKAYIEETEPDFICLNFANTDMVGHTGVFSAVVKAAETVDRCLKQLVETCVAKDYTILVTADHGNADFMINQDGSPNTAHSKNQVPLILIENDKSHTLKHGKLADIAPTILTLMKLPIPSEMDGNVLI